MQVKCKSKDIEKWLEYRARRDFILDSDSKGRGFESLRADHNRVTKKIPSEKARFHRAFSHIWGRLFQEDFIDAKEAKSYCDTI